MPPNNRDNCRTCPFNGSDTGSVEAVSRDAQGYFCDIHVFPIEEPERTSCANHPKRNPLWTKLPRGPVWAAVHISLDSLPLSRDILIPPEFVPPQGEGHYFRIPYFGTMRPTAGEAAPCVMCGETVEETIVLSSEERDLHFCSVAHYFEWWLTHDPEAKERMQRRPLKRETIRTRLLRLPEMLHNALEVSDVEGTDWLLQTLRELDELLLEIRFRKIASLHEALHSDDDDMLLSRLRIELSPHIQDLMKQLAWLGERLRTARIERTLLDPWIENMVRSIGGLVKSTRIL